MTQHESAETSDSAKPSIIGRGLRLVWRLLRWSLFLVIFYVFVVLVGLIPVNRGFAPPPDGVGVKVFVLSGAVHTDLILPVRSDSTNWLDEFPRDAFEKNCERYSHVAIGWGDRGFYLETPTWRELKASTAVNAMLLTSDSVMHVQFMGEPLETVECRAVRVSEEQYAALTQFIRDTFERKDDQVVPINGEAYNERDAFFVARGSYHAFNTCNCWAARGLAQTGVTVPWFAPMPRTILWYLPVSEADDAVADPSLRTQ